MSSESFAALDPAAQAAVRSAQLARKQARQQQKQARLQAKLQAKQQEAPAASEYRSCISKDEYFEAGRGGLFRDPSLPPTAESLALLLRALEAGDEQARRLGLCAYFQFGSGARAEQEAVWDATFNARLAWEGFFTITTSRGAGGRTEPLPELQPFYGVLLWPNFEASRHVRRALARLCSERRGLALSNCADPERTWQHIERYHRAMHDSNWLTRRYFEMMQAASDDPSINFTLHCIELAAEAAEGGAADGATPPSLDAGGHARLTGLSGRADLNGGEARLLHFAPEAGRWAVEMDGSREAVRVKEANLVALPPPPPPLAGEIGFSVGRVYTSLSGWTGERTADSIGTAQLVLLGRWLQRRGYAFWSLGHCYSPEMEYKRKLGHRIYPRADFRALLRRHRGPFELGGDGDGGGSGGAEREAAFEPLRRGERCPESQLL
jgi:hypothetical protein